MPLLAVLAATALSTASPPDIVCRVGYHTLSRRIAAAGLLYLPQREDRPWAEYTTPEGVRPARRYRVSRPGAEGHPAIVITEVGASSAGVDISTRLCCWGNSRECRNLREDLRAGEQQEQRR